MTVEEIKNSTSMRDVVERYGFRPNKNGFICCPFHHEKTASLKVYEESFYCFGCQVGGDIFKFVQLIEECDFKKAFEILGGTHNKEPLSDKIIKDIAKRKLAKQTKERKRARLQAEYIDACNQLHQNQKAIDYAPRDSDIYADALKKRTDLEYKIEFLFEELARKD